LCCVVLCCVVLCCVVLCCVVPWRGVAWRGGGAGHVVMQCGAMGWGVCERRGELCRAAGLATVPDWCVRGIAA